MNTIFCVLLVSQVNLGWVPTEAAATVEAEDAVARLRPLRSNWPLLRLQGPPQRPRLAKPRHNGSEGHKVIERALVSTLGSCVAVVII